MSLTRQ